MGKLSYLAAVVLVLLIAGHVKTQEDLGLGFDLGKFLTSIFELVIAVGILFLLTLPNLFMRLIKRLIERMGQRNND